MKLGNWMMAKSVICLTFGIVFVASPGVLLTLFGVPNLQPSTAFMTQLYGATFIVLGLLLWFTHNAADPTTLRGVVWSVTLGDAIGFIVVLASQLNEMMNALGWFVVVLYLLFTIGFAYFMLSRPAPKAV